MILRRIKSWSARVKLTLSDSLTSWSNETVSGVFMKFAASEYLLVCSHDFGFDDTFDREESGNR